MSDESRTEPTVLNPLIFLSLDPLFTGGGLKRKRFSSVGFLCDLVGVLSADPHKHIPTLRKAIAARHDDLAPLENDLFLVPAEKQLLDRIVWPLRGAKATYLLGNFLACIALAGTVGEMVAQLVFDSARLSVRGKALDEEGQKVRFDRTFERMFQSRRIRVLEDLGLWSPDQAKKARDLSEIRNKYLHSLAVDLTAAQDHARRAYGLAAELAAATVNLPIGAEGTVKITPQLRRYLKQAKAQDG
jgi:hypothetical protein